MQQLEKLAFASDPQAFERLKTHFLLHLQNSPKVCMISWVSLWFRSKQLIFDIFSSKLTSKISGCLLSGAVCGVAHFLTTPRNWHTTQRQTIFWNASTVLWSMKLLMVGKFIESITWSKKFCCGKRAIIISVSLLGRLPNGCLRPNFLRQSRVVGYRALNYFMIIHMCSLS